MWINHWLVVVSAAGWFYMGWFCSFVSIFHCSPQFPVVYYCVFSAVLHDISTVFALFFYVFLYFGVSSPMPTMFSLTGS